MDFDITKRENRLVYYEAMHQLLIQFTNPSNDAKYFEFKGIKYPYTSTNAPGFCNLIANINEITKSVAPTNLNNWEELKLFEPENYASYWFPKNCLFIRRLILEIILLRFHVGHMLQKKDFTTEFIAHRYMIYMITYGALMNSNPSTYHAKTFYRYDAEVRTDTFLHCLSDVVSLVRNDHTTNNYIINPAAYPELPHIRILETMDLEAGLDHLNMLFTVHPTGIMRWLIYDNAYGMIRLTEKERGNVNATAGPSVKPSLGKKIINSENTNMITLDDALEANIIVYRCKSHHNVGSFAMLSKSAQGYYFVNLNRPLGNKTYMDSTKLSAITKAMVGRDLYVFDCFSDFIKAVYEKLI